MNLDLALEQFEKAATLHALCNEKGEFKKGNVHHASVLEAAEFLKSNGSLSLLEKFLESNTIGVRRWAAAYLLTLNDQRAVAVLEAMIAQNIPYHSFNAKMLLSEWREGSLNL